MSAIYNPFYIQKFVGQNIITSKLEPGGKRQIASNIIFLMSYWICFITSFYFNSNRAGDVRYNFISQMRFAITLYWGSCLLTQMSITTTLWRTYFVNAFHSLQNLTKEFKKIGIEIKFRTLNIIVMYIVIFITVIPMAIFDIYIFGNKYTITFYICQYLPGVAISIYIINIATLLQMCTNRFQAIHCYLESCVVDSDSSLEKFYLSKQKLKPQNLFGNFPGEEYSIYQKLFIFHDDVSEVVRLINRLAGYELLVFMTMLIIAVLSFIYDISMDLVRYFGDNNIPPRTIYAPEYWCIISILGTLAIVSASTGLMEEANRTKTFLHRLRNTYPTLHVELFSLQLIHGKIAITAANFFTIHRGILYNLVSAWITYILLFMQLQTDTATI